jgi:hypothetical protein
MNTAYATTEISVSFLSWINEELRREVEKRKEIESPPRVVTSFKTFLVAGVSGGTFLALKLFECLA